MTKQNYVEIAVVLDRSGSMSAVRSDTIGGFNTFLSDQKANNVGDVRLSLTQFDDQYDVVYSGKSIQDVPPLTEATFVPRGMTALFDAVGKTINVLGERLAKMAEQDRPSLVIMVILTDGEENSSKEFSLQQVKDMIKLQTETYSWQFVFLGADQDAFQAQKMGIAASNTYNYKSADTSKTYGNLSRGISVTMDAMTAGDSVAACAAASSIGDIMRQKGNKP
jgi:hypothetical protein